MIAMLSPCHVRQLMHRLVHQLIVVGMLTMHHVEQDQSKPEERLTSTVVDEQTLEAHHSPQSQHSPARLGQFAAGPYCCFSSLTAKGRSKYTGEMLHNSSY
jgi:hypothetical protein